MIKINESWYIGNGLYKCPNCDRSFTKNGICSHIWKVHYTEGREQTLRQIKSIDHSSKKRKADLEFRFIKRNR